MYRQLAKRLEDSDEPQYAGVCYLATGCMHLILYSLYGTVFFIILKYYEPVGPLTSNPDVPYCILLTVYRYSGITAN
jgi:hypothetical protein